MKKTVLIFTLSLILTTAIMFSCGGGGGSGVDNAMKELFTISYNANGAESGIVPAPQNGDKDSPQSVQANVGGLAKSGYLFDGWNTSADGSGTNYAPGSSYKGTDVLLYAKWAAIFNVQVINPGSPVPALDGVQRVPGVPFLKILSLTTKGRSLANIDIPEAIDGYPVVSIGNGAFQDCSDITDFSIPETVTSIEDNAFAGCTGISTLTIPRSVTAIGNGTFSGCGGLSSLILLNPVPPTMGTDAMEGCTATISVPASGVDAYKAAEGWNTYSTSIAGYSTEIYTVSFDGQGATTQASPNSKEIIPPAVTIGQLPTPPQRIGYNFGGWFKEPLGAGGEFSASTVVSSNITVYAKWDEYSYTVRFNDQNATTPVGETSKAVSSPNTTVSTLPSEPANTGYYFGGWNTKSDGTGTVFTTNTVVTGDITVYAIWLSNPTFTVNFDGQGATTDASPSSKQVVSPAVTVGSLPTPPVRTGYIFGGWYNESEGAGGEFTASTVVTANKTVYAKWNSYSYTVTFNDQGATTPVGDTSNTVASPNTTIGTLPTEPANTGYYFGGWNTKADGTGTSFTTETPVTSDITVYAIWIKNPTYTVTFDGQRATTDADPTSKQVISPAVTVGSLPTPPLKTGYIFGGWFNEPEGAGGKFTASTVVTGDKTVYAKWNSYSYTVTFDGQEATTAADPTSIPVNSPDVTVGSLPTPPLKTGYTFGGWYNQPGGAGGEFTASTVVTANKTVYAKWNSYIYTVTFDSQGATTDASPVEKSVSSPNTKLSSMPSDPIKTGFIFDGWYTQPEGQGNQFTIDTVVEGNITIYAKWIALFSYSISNEKVTITGLTTEGNKLSSIVIPSSIDGKSVTDIGNSAFKNCSGITNITIPDGMTSIGQDAFNGCSNLTSIIIPDSVTSIGYSAFYNCNKLTSMSIPGGLITDNNVNGRYVEISSIIRGEIIKSATITGNPSIIIDDFFKDWNNLITIVLPDSIETFGKRAFSRCTNLKNINLPKNLISIGDYAFNGCTSLKSITVPNKVTTIGDAAFNGCTNLTSVIIPSSVISIGGDLFRYCTSLTSLTIPDSITCITAGMACECTNLNRIILSANATELGKSAFENCKSLTSITIPASVTTIGDSVFLFCTNLTSIMIPQKVTTIGNSPFQGCTGLTNVRVKNTIPPTAKSGIFAGCTKLSAIKVPAESVEAYKAADGWSDYANLIVADE